MKIKIERENLHSEHEENFICRIANAINQNNTSNEFVGCLISQLIELPSIDGKEMIDDVIDRIAAHEVIQCDPKYLKQCWQLYRLGTTYCDEISPYYYSLSDEAKFQIARLLEVKDREKSFRLINSCVSEACAKRLNDEDVKRMADAHLDTCDFSVSPLSHFLRSSSILADAKFKSRLNQINELLENRYAKFENISNLKERICEHSCQKGSKKRNEKNNFDEYIAGITDKEMVLNDCLLSSNRARYVELSGGDITALVLKQDHGEAIVSFSFKSKKDVLNKEIAKKSCFRRINSFFRNHLNSASPKSSKNKYVVSLPFSINSYLTAKYALAVLKTRGELPIQLDKKIKNSDFNLIFSSEVEETLNVKVKTKIFE